MVDSISMTGSEMRHFRPTPIYNYPEHLNPFYQDENHKRLRFFTLIGKKNGGRARSSSFSVSNLRDLWSFKSFRLRKKSSVLGINKTSESPPPLRKQDLYDSNFNTVSSTCRQTYNGSGGGGGGSGDAFQRNTPYRTSMGNLNSRNYDTQSDIIFNRSDGYRNTIQNVHHGQRYQANGGSVTPVMRQKFAANGLTPGHSQTSLRSTNPFEDDDGAVKVVPIRKYRKKRPAPPPPVQSKYVPKPTVESSTSDNIELRIVEEDSKIELPSISDLTAEIETLTKSVVQVEKEKETEQEDEKMRIVEEIVVVEQKKEVVEDEAAKKCNGTVVNVEEKPAELQIEEEKPMIVTVKQSVVEEKQKVNATDEAKIDSLRIVETTDKYEIRYLPLKDEQPTRRYDKETIRADFIRTDSTEEKPPEEVPVHNGDRRKSVKEIIEAINRSQGLLMATNYTPMHGKYEYGEFSDMPEIPQRSNLPVDATGTVVLDDENVELRPKTATRNSYYDNVPEILEQLEEKSATFERCSSIRRSKNKTQSPSSSYEWNPVPKPRRSHQNLSTPDLKE